MTLRAGLSRFQPSVSMDRVPWCRSLTPESPLDDYSAKRRFGRTPEPPSKLPADPTPATFVIHRHEARNLHYDLRVAMAGVLKCWAVPRGFSFAPSEKRLAVQTEDHPIEYETFEGVIPKGEYGAGTMLIWDRGRYELVAADDGPAAFQVLLDQVAPDPLAGAGDGDHAGVGHALAASSSAPATSTAYSARAFSER